MLSHSVVDQYPELFKEFNGTFNVSLGWNVIVSDLLSVVSVHVKENDIKDFSFYSFDTKFGILLIYKTQNSDLMINVATQFAERLSYKTCEVCGLNASLRAGIGKEPYRNYRTVCATHAMDSVRDYYTKV